jgi:hypothetical protein
MAGPAGSCDLTGTAIKAKQAVPAIVSAKPDFIIADRKTGE